MEAVRTIRPSRFPKPVHNLPLSQHKRLPANENAANENGPDKGGDPLAAAALAVLEAAERAGHLPPMTTEKFIAACKLAAANLPPANDDAAELAADPLDLPGVVQWGMANDGPGPGSGLDADLAPAPYVNANSNPDDYQAPEQGA